MNFDQVLVVIDARPNVRIQAISHKQFVEHVGISDVPDRYGKHAPDPRNALLCGSLGSGSFVICMVRDPSICSIL